MQSNFWMIVLMLATGAWPQTPGSVSAVKQSKLSYAGTWWTRADVEERSGFLNGSADCLTWTAHRSGFNATPEQLMDTITKFYKLHPESLDKSVVDVWQMIGYQPKSNQTAGYVGEKWKNPHWYLNGDWWTQVSEAQQLGFVEGYLYCLKTKIPTATGTYSGSASVYRTKIDAFIRAHPKQGKESVAITLRRYRDKTNVTPPK
jgi:hypothetical protein